MAAATKESTGLTVLSQRIDAAVWSVCDILRRSNCASAIQYVPELTWILFLRIFDERERLEGEAARAVGAAYEESLEWPFRWRDWAAPVENKENGKQNLQHSTSNIEHPTGKVKGPHPGPLPRAMRTTANKPVGAVGEGGNAAEGEKRRQLVEEGTLGAFFAFVNGDDGFFREAPAAFNVIVTNPPFGGKEGEEAQTKFAYKTSATQVLFLQHVIDHLTDGGRCGMVIDEGVLFRTNEKAFVQSKRKLLDACELWCIVSLPAGVFTAAGAGVKTNLLFFTKGKETKRVWYYDVSDIKVGKTKPFVMSHLDDFFERLPKRETEAGESPRSWWVDRQTIEERNFDLKAVNPNRKVEQDTRTPGELLDLIEAKGKEVSEAVGRLRGLLKEG